MGNDGARKGRVGDARVVEIPSSVPLVPEGVVRAELEKILTSPQFARSQRLSAFLDFVVQQALLGQSDRLNEYSIALAVYQRPRSFDPQLDPIVRAEAARLRSKLEQYYQNSGLNDPVSISLPKGVYTPLFQAQARLVSRAAAVWSKLGSSRLWKVAALLAVLAVLLSWGAVELNWHLGVVRLAWPW